MNGVLTLSDIPIPREFSRSARGRPLYRLQFGAPKGTDFQVELFPLHSPLLGESLLVSFPLLSYMLKSRRSSYLISDPGLSEWGIVGALARTDTGA